VALAAATPKTATARQTQNAVFTRIMQAPFDQS